MPFGRGLRIAFLLALLAMPAARAGLLSIESWRVDDRAVWDRVLIPAFERSHAGIEVRFAPTEPTSYDAELAARLAAGRAGDLVACRPFDASLALYRKGYLDKLDGKVGMRNFPATSMVAWQTDDARDTFCMPVASVIHGFLYNKAIFRLLHLQVPRTEAEFFALLDAVQRDGRFLPLALGLADRWEASQIVFTSIGPNHWRGEEGRKALISGQAHFTDPPFVAAFEQVARLAAYLPAGAAMQSYAESQAQFARERAAIYPAGSWDIAYFERDRGLELGAFAPPVQAAGDPCFISDHMDIGLGVNRRSKHKADAYAFLAWVGSQEFADLYTNRVTGFFSLSNHLISVRDPLARQMLDWRRSCASTIRVNAQVLDRGRPAMEGELWSVNSLLLAGKITPREAAARIQAGFASWYAPQRP
ncbi:MAG: carbohydrate ABC transporter substrate-binding protein [Burkholderiales bacterium]|nr:carbohydrate ABC transporter substrate-binding protein [Burkholderiales bacterium]